MQPAITIFKRFDAHTLFSEPAASASVAPSAAGSVGRAAPSAAASAAGSGSGQLKPKYRRIPL